MEINIDLQPLIDGFGLAMNWILSLIGTLIDTIIFIELNNPAEEAALFFTLIGMILGAIKLLSSLIRR